MGTFSEVKKANDTGDWNSNKEMNPAANSSVTEDTLLEDDATKAAGEEWRKTRDVDHGVSAGVAAAKAPGANERTGDPGRTPGKAEGVVDAGSKGSE